MNELRATMRGKGGRNPEYVELQTIFNFAYWFGYTPDETRNLTLDEIAALNYGLEYLADKQALEARKWRH